MEIMMFVLADPDVDAGEVDQEAVAALDRQLADHGTLKLHLARGSRGGKPLPFPALFAFTGTWCGRPPPPGRSSTMGIDDRIENQAEDMGGKMKEAAGKATDDERLEREGKRDQAKADLKDAAEDVKDAFKH